MYKFIQTKTVDKYDVIMMSKDAPVVYVLCGKSYEKVLNDLRAYSNCITVDCSLPEQEIVAQIVANRNTTAPLLIDKSKYDDAPLFLKTAKVRKAPLILYNNIHHKFFNNKN